VRLYEEFREQVHLRFWHYDKDHTYFSHQPGTLSRPDNSREAWQALCMRQLAQRWAVEVTAEASEIDVQSWLEQAGEDDAVS